MESHELTYKLADWKETILEEWADGRKTTRVEAEFEYSGNLAGKAKDFYLMHYGPDQKGTYHGWEHFAGTWQGSPAAVVFQIGGTFDPQGVSAQYRSETASGQQALAGLPLGFKVRFEGHGPYPVKLEISPH